MFPVTAPLHQDEQDFLYDNTKNYGNPETIDAEVKVL